MSKGSDLGSTWGGGVFNDFHKEKKSDIDLGNKKSAGTSRTMRVYKWVLWGFSQNQKGRGRGRHQLARKNWR